MANKSHHLYWSLLESFGERRPIKAAASCVYESKQFTSQLDRLAPTDATACKPLNHTVTRSPQPHLTALYCLIDLFWTQEEVFACSHTA